MNIVCVHGSGSSGEAWHYQAEAFDNVTAPSLPGHPDGALIPDIDGMVAWLRDFVVSGGLGDDLVLFGHSMGGAVVMQYALEHPQGLRALVLVGTGARLRVAPAMLEQLASDVASNAPWDPMAGYERIDQAVAEKLAKRRVENGLGARLNDLRACDAFDVIERLPEIQLPTLIVCGDEDVMTPPKYATFLADRMPNARATIVSGGTHQVHLEHPGQVNQTIAEFLDSL